MTREEAIKMAKADLKCMKRDTSGQDEMCNSHKCDECSLNYERGNMGERKEWLRLAIKALEQKPCEDAVSRKSVITIIQNHWWNCRDIDKLVNELPPVTPQESRWIPVSERMPKPNRLVLCYITTGATETYFLALWNDTLNAWEEGIGGYRLLENDLGYEVIAWMPLPEPYKVESEE